MRRSELEPRLTQALVPILSGARDILVVGAELELAGRSATCVADLTTLGSTPLYPAALWLVGGEFHDGFVALRRVLLPGARLVLLSPQHPPVLRRLRGWATGERVQSPLVEELCSALLIAGYRTPRVHPSIAAHHLISAELPQVRDALDAFFEQPAAHKSR
jgi:hypothetical protein